MGPVVEQVVDRICAQGCERTRQCIRALQETRSQPEYAHLDEACRNTLLQELQAIMAVYDDRC